MIGRMTDLHTPAVCQTQTKTIEKPLVGKLFMQRITQQEDSILEGNFLVNHTQDLARL